MDPEIQEVPLLHNDEAVAVDDVDDGHGRQQNKQIPGQRGQQKRNDPLDELEKAIENACETLSTMAGTVIQFSYESQDVLFTKVNELVKDLQEIDSKAHGVNAVIPFEVIEAIDKGRNPEQCTYQMLESCAEANNVARGKLDVMRSFRTALEKASTQPTAEGGGVESDAVGGVSTGNSATNGF